MKALKIWAYILLAAGIIIYACGIFTGEFNEFFYVFWGTSTLAAALLLASIFCVLLAVSLFFVIHAIKERES